MQRRINLIVLLFFISSVPSFAQQLTFHYKRKIDGPTAAGWYTIPLTVDIFKSIRSDFGDIRIFSMQGKDTVQVPYLLKVQEDEVADNAVELPVLNKSKRAGKLYLTVELKSNQKVNHLDLAFEEPNFNGYAKLEGSHDQQKWFDIDSMQRILSIRQGAIDFQSTSLDFPLSNYRYIRIEIQADVPLTLSAASFRKRIVKRGKVTQASAEWDAASRQGSGETIMDITLNEYQPVSSLRIEANEKNDFYRPLTIEALRDSTQTPKGWTYYYDHVASGYITSVSDKAYEFPVILAQKLRVTIHNGDNARLSFTGVTVTGPQVELVSNLSPGNNIVFYGNAQVDAPSYDVIHFSNKIPEDRPSLSMGTPENLVTPEAAASPLMESKYWLWAILVVVIGVLGFFTVRMMGKKS